MTICCIIQSTFHSLKYIKSKNQDEDNTDDSFDQVRMMQGANFILYFLWCVCVCVYSCFNINCWLIIQDSHGLLLIEVSSPTCLMLILKLRCVYKGVYVYLHILVLCLRICVYMSVLYVSVQVCGCVLMCTCIYMHMCM